MIIIAIITLAIVGFEFIIYFGGFLDHLFGTYFRDRRISVQIANEDLKKNLPDMVSFLDALNSFVWLELVVLQIIGMDSSEYTIASIVYIASGITMFFKAIKDTKYNIREILSVVIRTILLQVAFVIFE